VPSCACDVAGGVNDLMLALLNEWMLQQLVVLGPLALLLVDARIFKHNVSVWVQLSLLEIFHTPQQVPVTRIQAPNPE
jgi:hypothetical protein